MRVGVAVAAGLLRLRMVASPLAAQEGDGNELVNRANRLLASCNYVEYVNRINTLATSFFFMKYFSGTIKTLFDGMFGGGGGDLPAMDLLRNSVKKRYKKAVERQLFQTASGIVFQFEQACNTFKMAQDTERQMVELTKSNFNVRKMIKDVVTTYDAKITLVQDTLHVVANEALIESNLRAASAPIATDPDGVFEAAVDTAAMSAFGASAALQRGAAALEPVVAETKLELYEYAARDRTGKLGCPKGYDTLPNPMPPGSTNARGVICGPAQPARMKQVIAMLATVQMEIQGLRNGLKSQALALMAMRSLREAQEQRIHHLAVRNSLNAFTGTL